MPDAGSEQPKPSPSAADDRLGWPVGGLVIVACLCGLHFIPRSLSPTLDRWGDLPGEGNLSGWFGTVVLFLTAAFAYALAGRAPERARRRGWLLVAGLYLLMSLDESIGIHEALDTALGDRWIAVYSPVVALLGVLLTRFMIRERTAVVKRLLVGLAVQIAGAVGSEVIARPFMPLTGAWQHLQWIAEEGLEMAGAVLAAHACWHGWRRSN